MRTCLHQAACCIAALLAVCFPLFGADEQALADSTLFELGMELYDSIRSPSFPKMYKEALRKAKEADNESRYITFRRMLISKYFLENEQKKFIAESDRMIAYCQESGTEAATRLLYEIWSFKADRLDTWGRNEEELETARQMADYAQQHHHDRGLAMAEYLFGGMYLNRHQLETSESHLRTAWNLSIKNSYKDLAVRIGFNLLAMKMNTSDYDGGLAIADSIETLIAQRKADGARIAPVTMLKLARYRCKLLYLNSDLDAAAAQKDTMLYWYNVEPDPSQWPGVLYTQAGYKRYAGDMDGSCEDLDSLIRMARREDNWSLVANYTYALADARREQGNMDKAVDAYRRYAAAKDSATVQASNAQLNELTKKYELNELRWARKKAEYRFYLALGAALLLLTVVVGYFLYARKLREKNRALYDRIRQVDRLQEDLADRKSDLPESELSGEQKLFRDLRTLMRDEKPYRNPQLNREALASSLGTNTRYFAEAVKNCTSGQTVSEFINSCRLREAAELLTFHNEMSIVEVGEESGFGSNATFFRLFRDHFGMTPSEYRKISKEKCIPESS